MFRVEAILEFLGYLQAGAGVDEKCPLQCVALCFCMSLWASWHFFCGVVCVHSNLLQAWTEEEKNLRYILQYIMKSNTKAFLHIYHGMERVGVHYI